MKITQLPNQTMGRFTTAIAAALVITAALFWIMQNAIQEKDLNVIERIPVGTLVLGPQVDELPLSERVKRVEPPPEVKPLPPQAKLLPVGDGPATNQVEITPPIADPGDINKYGQTDGEALPILTVAPVYPRREQIRGIEGWVIVEFLIDELGRVQAAKVVDAEPGAVFNKAALKAVNRYKYKPLVINGQAQPVYGVRQRIVFNLS